MPYDMRKAPRLTEKGPPGCFLGDYTGLAATCRNLVAVHAQPHGSDPAVVIGTVVRTRP
ncbi:hypothetical protein ACFFOP_25720 [Sinosporangium siamense]